MLLLLVANTKVANRIVEIRERNLKSDDNDFLKRHEKGIISNDLFNYYGHICDCIFYDLIFTDISRNIAPRICIM